MRITKITIAGSTIDSPIRFPGSVQPALKVAPDTRIETEEEKDEHELDHYAHLEDVHRTVKFGGRNIL